MSEPVSVLGLLAAWESAQRSGKPLTAEALCRKHPHLLDQLRQRINELQAVNSALALPDQKPQDHDSTIIDGQKTVAGRWQGREVVAQANLQVLSSHARGGLGEVLIARDVELDRNVALKVLQSPYDRNADCRKRFLREAEITSQLEHPGIVPVHHLGADRSGRPCYTMRFIAGESLHSAIERYHRERASQTQPANTLRMRQLIQRCISVCNTVAFAHSRGILHRDLKPSNIILGNFSETLVVDWGLAKPYRSTKNPTANASPETTKSANADRTEVKSDHEVSLHDIVDSQPREVTPSTPSSREAFVTEQGGILGTPAFMSPEQARGEVALTPASDVYSLGAILYTVTVGKPAFSGDSTPNILRRVRSSDFAPPRTLANHIPPALEAIILHAMNADPQQRYASALELAVDLENWLIDEPISVYAGSWYDRALRWSRRHRTRVVAFFAASIVGLLSLTAILVITARNNTLLVDSNTREKQAADLAKQQADLADQNAQLADEQSRLALSILQTVIQDIQRELVKQPRSQKIRRDMLDKSMQGLQEVAATVERRKQIDRNQLIAHRDLGDIFLLIGDEGASAGTKTATRHFEAALEIARRLVFAAPGDRQARLDLATVCERMSTIRWLASDTESSKLFINELLQLRQTLAAETPDDIESQVLLANAHNHAGDLYLRERSVKLAGEQYAAALLATHELSTKHPNDAQVIRQHLITLNNCGEVHRRQREWAAALEKYDESLTIARKRYQADPADSANLGDLAFTLSALGKVHYSQGNYGAVEPYYVEAQELADKRFSQDPSNMEIQRDLLTRHQNLGDLMVKLNELGKAKQHFEAMLDLATKLSALDPESRTALHDLSIAHHRIGDVQHTNGESEPALTHYEESLKLSRALAAREPDNMREQAGVAIDLSNLALLKLDLERTSEALDHLEESVSLFRRTVKQMPQDATFRRQYFVVLSQWGAALRRVNDFPQARTANDESLQLVRDLLRSDPSSPALLLDYVTVLNSRGYIERSAKELREARKWFEQALEVIAELEQKNQLFGADKEWRADLEAAIASCDQPAEA